MDTNNSIACIGALCIATSAFASSPHTVEQVDQPALDRPAIDRPAQVREIKIEDNHIDIALDLIKKYEGFRSEPYRCAAGVLTIGYGETDPTIVDRKFISEPDALALLRDKIIDISEEIDNEVRTPLSTNQRAALISFYYNLGPGNFENIARRINSGDIIDATNAIILYDKCKGKRLEGLTLRRMEEQYLFTL
jgi:lysozyme